MNSIYKINKGINKPIEFKGLKAQYITYLAIGLTLLLLAFAIMYLVGINMFICLALTLLMGTALFMTVYRLSDRYGEFGLIKKMAIARMPSCLTCRSRFMFLQLSTSKRKEK